MSEPFQGDPPGALSDPEFWILLSLDDQSRLFDLLMPIVQHAGSEQRELRPRLRIDDGVEALIRLVRGGLVEIRAWPIDDSSPYDAPLLAASEVELCETRQAGDHVRTIPSEPLSTGQGSLRPVRTHTSAANGCGGPNQPERTHGRGTSRASRTRPSRRSPSPSPSAYARLLEGQGVHVGRGVFGARMQVALVTTGR